MKQFKKFDDYLLQHYPFVWETRVHIFFPLGLGIALFLFLVTSLSGWTLKDELPYDNTISITVTSILVLIYLVYWFIFQARHNKLRSNDNLPHRYEYFHFFSYMLLFSTAFLIISAIPLGNYQKIRNAVNEEMFKHDLENLNLGYSLIHQRDKLIFDSLGIVKFTPVNFTYSYYNKDNHSDNETIAVNLDDANQIISDYITSYNKYTLDTLDPTTYDILAYPAKPTDFVNLSDTVEVIDTVNTGEYRMSSAIKDHSPHSPYFYHDYNYYFESDVENKISWILTGISLGWYFEFMFPWFWKLILLSIVVLASLAWIFKNVQPHQFILGFIAICLTPILFNIADTIIFDALRIRGDDERIIFFGIIFTLYMLYILLIVLAYFNSRLHTLACVFSIQLQFFLPLLPVFVWGLFIFDRERDFDGEYVANFLYWSAIIISVISIAIFKPLYSKFRSLPSKN